MTFRPEGFSETIFKDRYSFTPEESWEQACLRVARQMALAESPEKQLTYQEKFNDILVNNEFVPGGRIWYNSGRTNPQMLNCFRGDTVVHIKGGTALAKDLEGEVETLSEGGIYRKAYWKCYGEDFLMKVILSNGDEIYATPDHDWITPHSIVKTKNLEGYKIPYQHPKNVEINDEEFLKGIQHGMVFGDGSYRPRKKSEGYTEVRQFGEVNTKLIHKYFEKDKVLSYQDKNYGTVYYATRLDANYKKLPDYNTSSQSYLRGFIAGLIATDGHIDKYGCGMIFQSNLQDLENIRKLASKAGIPSTSLNIYRQKNPWTNVEAPSYKLSFYKNVFKDSPDLVIKETHLNHLLESKEYDKQKWVDVVKVEFTGIKEKVYCCNEPETHTLVVGNGYLTKNCFVLSNQLDSKEGWGNISKEMIITSMTGGGCGIDFSDVRPRGATITGQKGEAPGPVALMELIDLNAKPVRAGGQRRVALMFSLDLDHPDIIEFLDAKLEKGKLTHANVSVRSKKTKEFIKAVKDDADWELSWKGKYKKNIKAKDLWNKIVTNAYNSAEPGFLNWELVENESNISYIEQLACTNPCGEIAMSSYDSCCLGHIVLSRFVSNTDMDWHHLANTIRTAVRFLDNVLTVNHYPLPEMKEKSNRLRRIGLGTTALADTLALLGLKYGSTEGNQFVDKLFRFISKTAYEASVMLAVEKGAFPACDPEKHLQSDFMKRMPNKIRALVQEHGIRNCALLTQAPTGTVSILSGNCSSGVEPMFAPAYERRYWDKDVRKVELVFHPLFKQFMEEGRSVDHFVGSHNLSPKDHMEVQKVVQRHIDNAVSKTINMANDFPVEQMSELWLEYLPELKGTTFYRDNTRGYVKEDGTVEEPPLKAISLEDAKARFNEEHMVDLTQELDCKKCSF